MMGDPGPDTSGAKGTADVNVITGADIELTEFADFNPLIRRGGHY